MKRRIHAACSKGDHQIIRIMCGNGNQGRAFLNIGLGEDFFFAGIAVLLAAIGIYGVLAYQVSQRKAELGLRLAIGASEGDLVRMILKRGMLLLAVGLAVGLAVAYPGSLAVRQLIYGVELLDVSAYLGAVLTLALVAALASGLPARRASHGDVVDVLRAE